jgi:REP element-mobilizing transposase RayT
MRLSRRLIVEPNSTIHKIWRCHNREFLLKNHHDKHAYLRAIFDDYTKRCSKDDFTVQAYNVMSNHVHEIERIKKDVKPFSTHMQRAHGKFGLDYNKRHKRLGKVALDRPKTLTIENNEREMRCMFYIDCNPVRAKIIKHPTDALWKDFSSCRYYAYGKKNKYDEMIELPEWYLNLGKTPKERQKKYRSLLDKYMVEEGLKRNPNMSYGYFLGSESWIIDKKNRLSELRKMKE